MKIKSVTDVITNSSTEVFTVKIEDLELAKSIPEIYNKMFIKTLGSTNILDRFICFKSIEDIQKIYIANRNLDVFSDLGFDSLYLRPFSLSRNTEKLLKDFGHTEKEINEYIARKDKERIEKRNNSSAINSLVGKATLEFYDHIWLGYDTEFEKWLKENKKEFEHVIG